MTRSSGGEVDGAGAHAAWLRGLGYARRAQWPQAIRALRSALESDPGHLESHIELGRALSQTGQAFEGLRMLERALVLPGLDDAARVRVLRLLGRASIQEGDYARAAEAFEEALAITGQSSGPILNQLAEVMCKSGDFERGFALFLRADAPGAG